MDHPFGIWSLVPPVLAIGLAMTTRRVVLSLFLGVVAAAMIVARGNPVTAAVFTFETSLWAALADEGHLRVFAFTLLMGAMVGVIHRSGGMLGVVDKLAPLARSRRGGQLLTWLLGLIIFFDDYANTLLLGTTMGPVSDRLKISREKLSYLVDSTAAPVAGLALVSTWVAGEIGYIEDGLVGLTFTTSADGFTVFVATIPYRFYVLLALLLVPMIAVLGRDFGPMLTAERRAIAHGGQPRRDGGVAAADEHSAGVATHWLNAVVPILIVLAVTCGLLWTTGAAVVRADQNKAATFFNIVSSGDSYLALVYGSLAGVVAAFLLARLQKILTVEQCRSAALDGARLMLPALMILWLAWSLSGVTKEKYLGTGTYLAGLLEGHVSVVWMPTLVFLLSSLVSFATGTSWGTMGLLTPLVVRVTYGMLAVDGAPIDVNDPLLVGTIGSVLAGSIFGDHCSPISDTTVLSAQASQCDLTQHVVTQLPYALLAGGVAVVAGTIPVGFGISVWLTLPAAVFALFTCLLIFGRRVESD